MIKRIGKMRILIFIVAVVSLLLGANQGICDDLSSIIKEMKTRNKKFQQAIKDMTMLQETRSITKGGEMVLETEFFKKGEKFRIKSSMQMPSKGLGETKLISIYDGKDFWSISSRGKSKLPREQAQPIIKAMKRIGRKGWSDELWKGARLMGVEKIGKKEAYVIEVISQKDESLFIKIPSKYQLNKIWLDKESLVALKAQAKGPEGETMLGVYSDYRKIKSVGNYPCKIEMYENGKLVATSIVKLFEINKGLSDDLFDPDKVEVKPSPPGTKSQEHWAWTDIDCMTTAMEMYYLDCGCYPSGKGEGKKATVGLSALVKNVENKSSWAGPYIKFRRDVDKNNIPEDPWGNEYEYEAATSNAKEFTIWCKGAKENYKAHYVNAGDFKSSSSTK